jgi:hypothetical protein
LLNPRNPNFNVVIGNAEHHQQKWLFFVEGRQTQNSEDNIELGDGGNMTSVVWYFMGWLFFFEEPGMC